MSTYALILFFSLVGPLFFSFHSKIRFYKHWIKAISASLIVSVPFLVWDCIATTRGSWGFTERFVNKMRFVGLPIEEILFFLVIPFCCLFLWNLIEKKNLVSRSLPNRYWEILIGCCFFLAAVMLRDKFYTSTILVWSTLTLLAVRFLDRGLLWRKDYWVWIAVTFVPFLLVNGFLTYLPIVWYSQAAILGARVISIPVEDFLYSWSLLTLNLIVYRKISSK